MHGLIGDITSCIPVRLGLGLLAHVFRQPFFRQPCFRQPLIRADLTASFGIGPFGRDGVKSQESISIIAQALAPLRVLTKSWGRTRS